MAGMFEGSLHRIVGVVDLLGGKAVHAIAGERAQYQTVRFCGGDALSLASHYAALGIKTLYIADLDAIAGKQSQSALLQDLSLHFRDRIVAEHRQQDPPQTARVIVDLGWRGDSAADLGQVTRINNVESALREQVALQWIAATECMKSTESLAQLVKHVGKENVILSLDFRDGRLQGNPPRIEPWGEKLISLNIASVIVLDVASVGTGNGGTTSPVCRRLKKLAPDITLYSGGGVRSPSDLDHLFRSGCDLALLATALHPNVPAPQRP